MIVLDSSALVTIARKEPRWEEFSKLIARETAVVSPPTLVETAMVLTTLLPETGRRFLSEMSARPSIRTAPFTSDMYLAAVAAFDLYGKGRGHPAGLNFGDCLSYGAARVLGLPLLFVGNDFSQTDIVPAWRP